MMDDRCRRLFASFFVILLITMGIGSQTALRADTFIIPHFVAGRLGEPGGLVDRRFATRITAVNTSNAESSLAFDAFDDSGNKVDIIIFGPSKVSAQGAGQYFVDNATLVSGWLRVNTSQPAIVRGSILFIQFNIFDLPPAAGFPGMTFANTDSDPAGNFLTASVPVSFFTSGSTGIAVAYPSTAGAADVTVLFTLRDSDGGKVADKTIKVTANGHTSFLIEDLFPQVRVVKAGVLNIQSLGSPIYGVAIEFNGAPFWMRTVQFGKLQ